MHKYTKSQFSKICDRVDCSPELLFAHLILKILIPVIVKTIVYMRNDIS